jgi:hypothetical protein
MASAPAADALPEPLGRADWVDLLERLTQAFAVASERGGSPARAQLPGAPAGAVVPSMEGFARMSVAWGAWLGLPSNPVRVGSGAGAVDIADLMVRGLVDGTSDRPVGWGPMSGRDQRIVEAAELAAGLWLGRERLVPLLGPERLAGVLRWLSRVHGLEVYDDNWYLFPVIVATVRRGLGEAVPDALIDDGLDRVQRWDRGDGWYTDGPGRAHDSYTGWAIHWYQLLWASIDGARRPRLRDAVRRRAAAFLGSATALVTASGGRPFQGRSLGYRFADGALFALAELLGEGTVAPGLARRLASARIRDHLAAGALDPATGWFRRGVGAERPEVLERYVSAGASAWAAHALVGLGIAPDLPFWTAPGVAFPVERGDGSLALRGPGFLIGWRRATDETWLHSALAGHPSDIPGHDYRAYYGKLAYRSAFPMGVRASDGGPAIDDAIAIEAVGGDGRPVRAIRAETEAGGAGPGWTWSRATIDVAGGHRLTTVVLPVGPLDVRIAEVDPSGPVRLVDATPALPVAAGAGVREDRSSRGALVIRSTSGTVGLRPLVGSGAVAVQPESAMDLNLVADRTTSVRRAEEKPGRTRRMIASVVLASADPAAPLDALDTISVTHIDRRAATVEIGPSETARVVAGRPERTVEAAGRRVEGRLRVLRWRTDGSAFAGEAIAAISGVLSLDRPGPVSIARIGSSIEVTALDAFEIDPAWAAVDHQCAGGVQVRVLDLGIWLEGGVISGTWGLSRRDLRRWQRRLGRRFVTVRFGCDHDVPPTGPIGAGR